MNLYLVRHGDALNELQDPARGLSARGRSELETLARQLASRVQADRIVHSAKARAVQSAEILHSLALPNARCEMLEGLNPNDPVEPMAERLEHEDQDLVVVGHLPYVSLLGSKLASRDADRTLFRFDTGTCLALARHGGYWSVQWMLVPELL